MLLIPILLLLPTNHGRDILIKVYEIILFLMSASCALFWLYCYSIAYRAYISLEAIILFQPSIWSNKISSYILTFSTTYCCEMKMFSRFQIIQMLTSPCMAMVSKFKKIQRSGRAYLGIHGWDSEYSQLLTTRNSSIVYTL